MDNFLETYNLPRLNQEEKDNLNKSIMDKEIESSVKNLPQKKNLGFTGEFYQIFK